MTNKGWLPACSIPASMSTGSGGPGGSAALVGGFQSALLTAVGFAILSVVVSLLVVREVRLTRSKTSV